MLSSGGTAAAPASQPPTAAATFELPRLPAEGDQLILTHAGQRLAIRRAEPADPRLPPLPVGVDILADATPRAFGREERCAVRQAGPGLELACAPGRSPAGLLLKIAARYPQGAALSGRIDTQGDAGFAAQFSHAGNDADEARPLALGTLLPLPVRGGGAAAQLTLLAPSAGGVLRIGAISLEPTRGAAPSPPPAAAWAWEPELWQRRGEALLRAAARRGLGRLIVTLSIRDGKVEDSDRLAGFVTAAGRLGIAVEAVEGDPDMVFAEGLAAAEVRARAIGAYQRGARPEARLAGVQFDIEPYALAAWGRRPADFAGWSEAVRRLSRAAGEPIHLVLPFWLAEEEEGRAFLEQVAPAVSGITIMAYRTEAAAVTRIAEPLLDWSGAAGKPLRVALEAGPVGEEIEERFVPAARGRIALAQADGKVLATLLAKDAAVPGARMFASTGVSRTPPDRISFLGQEREMVRMADALAAPLAAWPAFAGFSYHGLDWRR